MDIHKSKARWAGMFVAPLIALCLAQTAFASNALEILHKARQSMLTQTYSATEYSGLEAKSSTSCNKIYQRRNNDGSVYLRREQWRIGGGKRRCFAIAIVNGDGYHDMFVFRNNIIRGICTPGGIPALTIHEKAQYTAVPSQKDGRNVWKITGALADGSMDFYVIDQKNYMVLASASYDRNGKLQLAHHLRNVVVGANLPDELFAIPQNAEITRVSNTRDASDGLCEIVNEYTDGLARERKRLARQRRRQIRNSKILGVFSRITGSDDPLAWFLDNAPFLLMPVAVIAIGTACAIKRRKRK